MAGISFGNSRSGMLRFAKLNSPTKQQRKEMGFCETNQIATQTDPKHPRSHPKHPC
jgi:hypothetical protein